MASENNMGAQFLHFKLSQHLNDISKATESLPDDIDAFGQNLTGKGLFETYNHISAALSSFGEAKQAHNRRNYVKAAYHLVTGGNRWIRAANAMQKSYPDTPLALSFMSRASAVNMHIDKYNQLASETYTDKSKDVPNTNNPKDNPDKGTWWDLGNNNDK